VQENLGKISYNIIKDNMALSKSAIKQFIFIILAISLGFLIYKFYPIYKGIKPAFLPGPKIQQTSPIPKSPPPSPKKEKAILTDQALDFLKLPENFVIQIFAKNINGARVIKEDPAGNLIVSLTKEGKIVSLPDLDQDGRADKVIVLLSGLQNPHGMEVKCWDAQKQICKLYVAETEKLVQYDLVFDEKERIYRPVNPEKFLDLPKGGRHFTRTLLFLPYPEDHKLLISVGSTCDVCYEKDERNGTILVYDFQTKESKIYAKGLRNSVFLTLHPVTGKVWATEMGRDWLGDDLPPDEINIIEEGKNYGWPICYGKNIHDDNFDKNVYIRNPCMEPFEVPSYIDIPAHSSPLGLAFFPEEGWPEKYWYNLLVSYHGSWNRSTPTGYKIVRYILDSQGNYLGERDFISGWLQGDQAIGRPVDILIKPGGIIYISDDKANMIYRVIYVK
jgi:glucose/arabinose dehydrogenase